MAEFKFQYKDAVLALGFRSPNWTFKWVASGVLLKQKNEKGIYNLYIATVLTHLRMRKLVIAFKDFIKPDRLIFDTEVMHYYSEIGLKEHDLVVYKLKNTTYIDDGIIDRAIDIDDEDESLALEEKHKGLACFSLGFRRGYDFDPLSIMYRTYGEIYDKARRGYFLMNPQYYTEDTSGSPVFTLDQKFIGIINKTGMVDNRPYIYPIGMIKHLINAEEKRERSIPILLEIKKIAEEQKARILSKEEDDALNEYGLEDFVDYDDIVDLDNLER